MQIIHQIKVQSITLDIYNNLINPLFDAYQKKRITDSVDGFKQHFQTEYQEDYDLIFNKEYLTSYGLEKVFEMQSKNKTENNKVLDQIKRQLMRLRKPKQQKIVSSMSMQIIGEYCDMKTQLNLSSCCKRLKNRLQIHIKYPEDSIDIMDMWFENYSCDRDFDEFTGGRQRTYIFHNQFILKNEQNLKVLSNIMFININIRNIQINSLLQNGLFKKSVQDMTLTGNQFIILFDIFGVNLTRDLHSHSLYQTKLNLKIEEVDIRCFKLVSEHMYNCNIVSIQFPSDIQDEHLQYFEKATIQMHLNNCINITDIGLKYLSNVKGGLNLSGCNKITNSGLRHLSNITHGLNIGHCENITDEGLKHLSKITHDLTISGCPLITDNGLQYLSNITHQLDLCLCNITNEGLKYLQKITHHLHLDMCYKISDDGLKYLQQITHGLGLLECNITDNGLKYLSKLTHSLNLEYCPLITDEGLKHLSKITHSLSLSGCSLITNEGLKHLSKITHTLSLYECSLITDVGLRHLSNIKYGLDLRDCSLITDTGLKYLSNMTHGLRITGCDKITEEGLQSVSKILTNF